MLVTYEIREGGLLKNLCKMKSKRDEDAAIKTNIVNLFEELDLPNKADEMLAEYVGREEVADKSKKIEVKQGKGRIKVALP
jgi:hypothetical protein